MRKPIAGELWRHRRGLEVRVLGEHVPGDRDDELQVYGEVVARFDKRLSNEEIVLGMDDYEVGHRDGWVLCQENGWSLVFEGYPHE